MRSARQSRPVRRRKVVMALEMSLLCLPSAHAASGILTVGEGTTAKQYSASALLRRPDVTRLDLSRSGEPLGASVPAVPLPHLVASSDQGLSFAATDNFVARIPPDVFSRARRDGTSAWIAIEEQPWPRRDGQDIGPFALVWTGPGAEKIDREQWVDHLAAITPGRDAKLPAATGSVARRGRDVFTISCLPCHRVSGAGYGTRGPDLGGPLPVSRRLTKERFDRTVRHPEQVRPDAVMKGFTAEQIPDADLDAIRVWLGQVGPATTSVTQPSQNR
ncbi:cytochrome c [Acetobacter musti]|uniref:Cytochrome c n=1 Tax=Acetobacter musti TaxID=864732 RepID=A0ABX0JKZ0_9PROT|nr:cytochrome c [Acetobacter musti]NHN84113.1 cytochrome c [Acetobacter musti]